MKKIVVFKIKWLLPLLIMLTVQPVVAKQYFIYGDKKNGTKFKEKLFAWNVPLKKSYSKLTPKQKLIVLENYPDIDEGDKPPYPQQGMIKILKPFVKEFRWFGEFSAGTIYAKVNSNGRVVGVGGSPEMHAIIVDHMNYYLRSINFDPGTCIE